MSSNKRNEDNMYDVSTYSDGELYDILDLSNPTDRELEAKIIFLYRKYKIMQNDSGEKLANFFYDIHNHFFENDYESEKEEENDSESNIEGMTTLLGNAKIQQLSKLDDTLRENGKIINDFSIDNRIYNKIDESKYTEQQKNFVNNVHNLEYTKGNLNPLLKETITRIITIDSQYRSNQKALSTSFTFELSEPLRDVVSLSLYSVQIPYTWYTITNSYGSNFFYIKGNSPGINNGNHDIKVEISAGNYNPGDLITAISNSIINNYSLYTDISFANTNISYNPYTSLTTINIGITNQYSENSYHLNFSDWTTPYVQSLNGIPSDVLRGRKSLTSFLGLGQQNYELNIINSNYFTLANNTLTNNIIKLHNTSKTITIIKYISQINTDSITGDLSACLYTPGVTEVDKLITISLSLPSGSMYNRNQIINDLSAQILKNTNLSNESSITLLSVTDITSTNYGKYYFQLKIKPNRYTTTNNTNSKLLLQFPDESNIGEYTPLWTGSNSCFYFEESSNELQLLKAEAPIVKDTEFYKILPGPYVSLKCVNSNFLSRLNDISFNLQLNQSSNIYTISQLIDSINTGIINVSNNFPFLNAIPALSYANTNNVGNYSFAYRDSNNTFSLALNIEKKFNNNNYQVDFTDTSFNILFLLGNNTNNEPITNSQLTNINSYNIGFNRITINNGSKLFKINPITDICGNDLDNIEPIIYNNTINVFNDSIIFSDHMTSYLQNYKYQGSNLFTSDTNISFIENNTGTYTISLNLYITRKITTKDYNVQFVDTVNPNNINNNYYNIWTNPLKIANTFIDNSYNLNNTNIYLNKLSNSNAITIKSTQPIENVTITFNTSISNKLTFIADEDGVYVSPNSSTYSTSNNNITITIPETNSTGNYIEYTRDYLINTINNLLSEHPLSKGSFIYLTQSNLNHNNYLRIRVNINKIFRANDYKIVFYDTINFVKCYVGASGVQNTTWDSTLGWILGYRNSTYYILSDYTADVNNTITIKGETAVSTNLYNYFLICLDDFNLNNLNDGLVTITGQDMTRQTPTNTNRSKSSCDPITQNLLNSNSGTSVNNMVSNVYQNANDQNSNIQKGQSSKSYGKGPFTDNVFAMIPLKLSGLPNGSSYVEFGGTLQNNNRYYFGPVNISRMSIKLINDKGNVVDLNNQNWSFSFVCQQLYKKVEK